MSAPSTRAFSIVREGVIVNEITGVSRALVRLGPREEVELVARLLAPEIFDDGPSCAEVTLEDGRGRQIVVEVRRLFGRTQGQLRHEAVARAARLEQELALAKVRIAKLEQALQSAGKEGST